MATLYALYKPDIIIVIIIIIIYWYPYSSDIYNFSFLS